jgi:hypothetical protein
LVKLKKGKGKGSRKMNKYLNDKVEFLVSEFVKNMNNLDEYKDSQLFFSVSGFDFKLVGYKLEEKGFKVELQYLEDNGIYFDTFEEFDFEDLDQVKMYLFDSLDLTFDSMKNQLKKIMLDNAN